MGRFARSSTVDSGVNPPPHQDWVHLNPGDRIIIEWEGFPPQPGTVDEISNDSTYFWVWLDGQSRTLIFDPDDQIIRSVTNVNEQLPVQE